MAQLVKANRAENIPVLSGRLFGEKLVHLLQSLTVKGATKSMTFDFDEENHIKANTKLHQFLLQKINLLAKGQFLAL